VRATSGGTKADKLGFVTTFHLEGSVTFHWFKLTPIFALGMLLTAAQSVSAQRIVAPLFLDDFESYNLGSLDFNDPMGPNQGMNGDLNGNPWFGPEISAPNCYVVGPENGVTPHSGNQMIRGRDVVGADFDQDWFNLAYRLNGGQPFTGEVILSWWFYDTLGAGGTDFRDYVALAYYDTAPPDTDAPPSFNLNSGVNQIQRLSLGATFHTDPGFDPNYYQARVVNATDGYNAAGWFNTSVARSVGWHHGVILVGPAQDDGTAMVFFFIDDTLGLAHNSETSYGFNVIEINAKFGPQTGYFDDISFEEFGFGQ
jgi:hypothetical protein